MVANLVSKRDPKIARNSRISWENWDFPSPKLLFSSHKIQFSSTAFQFLQPLSAFFNGFLIFLNGFPLSKKSGKIYLWWQVYERSLSELCISAKIAIFRDKIIGGKNTKDHYPSFVFSAPSFVILAN
jgi:hypothetical protein